MEKDNPKKMRKKNRTTKNSTGGSILLLNGSIFTLVMEMEENTQLYCGTWHLSFLIAVHTYDVSSHNPMGRKERK